MLSSSSFFAGGKFGDQFALLAQPRRCAASSRLIVMFAASRVDYRVYRKAAPALLVLSILMMIGLFFLGVTIRDTRRWFLIPLINTTLQPSEVARTALVFFLAYWMTRTGKTFSRFKTGFLPAAGAIALVAGIIAALPNFGTATATIVIALCMMLCSAAAPAAHRIVPRRGHCTRSWWKWRVTNTCASASSPSSESTTGPWRSTGRWTSR